MSVYLRLKTVSGEQPTIECMDLEDAKRHVKDYKVEVDEAEVFKDGGYLEGEIVLGIYAHGNWT